MVELFCALLLLLKFFNILTSFESLDLGSLLNSTLDNSARGLNKDDDGLLLKIGCNNSLGVQTNFLTFLNPFGCIYG
jgi:hypothetical protein